MKETATGSLDQLTQGRSARGRKDSPVYAGRCLKVGDKFRALIHITVPDFLNQECFDDFLEPRALDLFPGVPRVKDGCVAPPEGPGTGVGLNQVEARKRPHGQDSFPRLFEDGWQQRQ